MKLVYVVLTLGSSKLDTLVRDDSGKLRRIKVEWQTPDDPYTPPSTWGKTAFGEVEYQIAEEAHPNPIRKYL